MKTKTVEKTLNIPTVSCDVPADLIHKIDRGIELVSAEFESQEKAKKEYQELKEKRNSQYLDIVKEKFPDVFFPYLKKENLVWRFDPKHEPRKIEPSDTFVVVIPGLPEFRMRYSIPEWLYSLPIVDDFGAPSLKYSNVFMAYNPDVVLGRLALAEIGFRRSINLYKDQQAREQEKILQENEFDAENEPVYVNDDPTINSDLPDQPQKDYDSLAYEFINIADNLIDSRLAFHGLL